MLKERDNRLCLEAPCINDNHTTRFVIKNFNHIHMYGGDMNTDGHKRAYRKWV